MMDAGTASPKRAFRIATADRISRPAAIACIILLLLVLLPVFAGRNLIQDLIFLFYMLALAQCWNLLAGYAA
jgi:branched-chain amino acid transport system permease protein